MVHNTKINKSVTFKCSYNVHPAQLGTINLACLCTNAFSWLLLLKKKKKLFSLILLQFRQYIKQKRLLKPQLKKIFISANVFELAVYTHAYRHICIHLSSTQTWNKLSHIHLVASLTSIYISKYTPRFLSSQWHTFSDTIVMLHVTVSIKDNSHAQTGREGTLYS